MEYRLLGASGLSVSRLTLGTMTFGAETDLEGSFEQLDAFVEAELSAPVDVTALATAAGDSAKAQVYAAARMAIRVDNPAENDYMNQLATALGLDAATRARLDSGMA